MNCIFCKSESSMSRSVEHILPESVGNAEHVLPPGTVCDGCNNYFASKIEQPLLQDPYFREQCSLAGILSKKGNLPRVRALHPQSRTIVELVRHLDGSGISIGAAFESDEKRWIESLQRHESGRIYVSHPTEPDAVLMARFLGKIALECLALEVLKSQDNADMVASEPALDRLRNYVRRGPPKPEWPFCCRALYPADFAFHEDGSEPYEVLHEWSFLWIGEQLHLVLALFGVEYAINLNQSDRAPYDGWVAENPGRSPLYPNGLPDCRKRSYIRSE